jgi:hypothetical protein
VDANGNIIPVSNETNNSNALSLGISNTRWRAVYIGDNDTYGSNTQPIYWNNGVPTALTYTVNKIYYSNSGTNYIASSHYINNT